MLVIVAYNLIGCILRGIGDSKTPLITVAIASIFNVIGDLILCAGFQMGTRGAAIATVFAQIMSVIISLWIIKRKELPFDFCKEDLKICKKYLRKMIGFGALIALQDLLVSISFLIILAIVNGMGVVASAGVGVAEKVCAFIMLQLSCNRFRPLWRKISVRKRWIVPRRHCITGLRFLLPSALSCSF